MYVCMYVCMCMAFIFNEKITVCSWWNLLIRPGEFFNNKHMYDMYTTIWNYAITKYYYQLGIGMYVCRSPVIRIFVWSFHIRTSFVSCSPSILLGEHVLANTSQAFSSLLWNTSHRTLWMECHRINLPYNWIILRLKFLSVYRNIHSTVGQNIREYSFHGYSKVYKIP